VTAQIGAQVNWWKGREGASETLAQALAGGWRAAPPPLDLSRTRLEAVVPVLIATGAAGIVWRRLDAAEPTPGSAAARLQEADRFNRLHTALMEENLTRVVLILQEREITPLLAKGWAVSAYYAERALRPYVDLDLYLHPDDVRPAMKALFPHPELGALVDAHEGLAPRSDRRLEEVLERSREVPVGSTSVTVPCEEDHLRLLCQHLWGHSAWRPLWLCDIAAVVEDLAPTFDWDLCLEGSARYRRWIACAIGLARDVLGARIDGTPFHDVRLPSWLRPALLKQWERCLERRPAEALRGRLGGVLLRPSELVRELRSHWPDPIEVTFAMDRPINGIPRGWYQTGAVLSRLPHFLRRKSE
jgi:hypothetical protein